MITVYTQPACPFCTKAKNYLDFLCISYDEIDIRVCPDSLAFMRAEGHQTVPQLYVGGKLLVAGGYDGLVALDRDAILNRVAALS